MSYFNPKSAADIVYDKDQMRIEYIIHEYMISQFHAQEIWVHNARSRSHLWAKFLSRLYYRDTKLGWY
jgi:hypothetical protein